MDAYFMGIAELTASLSRCVRLHVGAVIALDERPIATGYNGTVSGEPNCEDAFRDGAFTMEQHHDWSNVHEIHAEMNAVAFAARSGIALEGCTMYVTHQPCDQCLKNLYQCGIRRIVYKNPYLRTTDGNVFMRLPRMTVERYIEEEMANGKNGGD